MHTRFVFRFAGLLVASGSGDGETAWPRHRPDNAHRAIFAEGCRLSGCGRLQVHRPECRHEQQEEGGSDTHDCGAGER